MAVAAAADRCQMCCSRGERGLARGNMSCVSVMISGGGRSGPVVLIESASASASGRNSCAIYDGCSSSACCEIYSSSVLAATGSGSCPWFGSGSVNSRSDAASWQDAKSLE